VESNRVLTAFYIEVMNIPGESRYLSESPLRIMLGKLSEAKGSIEPVMLRRRIHVSDSQQVPFRLRWT